MLGSTEHSSWIQKPQFPFLPPKAEPHQYSNQNHPKLHLKQPSRLQSGTMLAFQQYGSVYVSESLSSKAPYIISRVLWQVWLNLPKGMQREIRAALDDNSWRLPHP
jgi:hypothetical protein